MPPKEFVLDPRLNEDCFVVGKLKFSLLLLMNNSLAPWFILVPETTARELYELDRHSQSALLEEIQWISQYVKENFDVSKLNVAAIGNIVNQLHVHIVGRSPSDYCWPGVVWGAEGREAYAEERVKEIVASLRRRLGDKFQARS